MKTLIVYGRERKKVRLLPTIRRIRFGPTDDDCWEWIGRLTPQGYGRDTGSGEAHRTTYQMWRGDIPEGLELDHLCRNRRCVNPWHLEPVTRAENVRRAGMTITHCKNGHEYTPENTYWRPGPGGGARDCRACIRARVRLYKQRKVAA